MSIDRAVIQVVGTELMAMRLGMNADPGVFTRLLTDLGVKGLRVEELWGLDSGLLDQLA